MSVMAVTDKHGDVFLADAVEPAPRPSKMPRQKRGSSKQNYQTPPEFLAAVKRYLGIQKFAYDLAAEPHTAAAERYFTKETDGLAQSWTGHDFRGWLWLNPPYDDIPRWVKKAYEQSLRGAKVAVLVPASVGANWWRDWVHEKAGVVMLNGRIKFVGCEWGYPKDLALLLYGVDPEPAYRIWTWPKQP